MEKIVKLITVITLKFYEKEAKNNNKVETMNIIMKDKIILDANSNKNCALPCFYFLVQNLILL